MNFKWFWIFQKKKENLKTNAVIEKFKKALEKNEKKMKTLKELISKEMISDASSKKSNKYQQEVNIYHTISFVCFTIIIIILFLLLFFFLFKIIEIENEIETLRKQLDIFNSN